jgi:hypothetical protein
MRTQLVLTLLFVGADILNAQSWGPMTGACQVSPTADIVIFPGSSARGPQFNRLPPSPWLAQYGPATFFRNTRVVGVNVYGGPVQAAAWQSYVQNNIVSPTAFVEVSAQMVIDPQFWVFTHPDGSSGDVAANGNVTFTLNGATILGPLPFTLTATSADRTPSSNLVSFCVPVDASLLSFAGMLVNPATNASIPCADKQSNETTCPGINEVEALGQVDHGTGVDIVAGATKIIYRAMDPVVLITGCCQEDSSFWGGTENSNDFLYGLSTHYIPYSTRSEISQGGANGVLSGTIAQGAGSLNVQIPLVAKEFGSSWVHVVAHSKGGLNARYLIGAHWLDSPRCWGVVAHYARHPPSGCARGRDYQPESEKPFARCSWSAYGNRDIESGREKAGERRQELQNIR